MTIAVEDAVVVVVVEGLERGVGEEPGVSISKRYCLILSSISRMMSRFCERMGLLALVDEVDESDEVVEVSNGG